MTPSKSSKLVDVREGGKAALASALARLEQSPDSEDSLSLLSEAYNAPKAQVIGITGPPGVGKSTLTGALIRAWRKKGQSVGVIAVDPSSRRSGGALLGDRVRFATDADDMGVFVRSMAARDRLGGLAEQTMAAMVLMRAIFDRVLIETVGVGQSETDVVGVADTVLFCVQPGSGDSLQFMKAGIVEIPHVALVTKADMGIPAERARGDLLNALALAETEDGWPAPVLMASAANGTGMEELLQALDSHFAHLAKEDRLQGARRVQAEGWLKESVRERFGREGLRRAGSLSLAKNESPFRRLAQTAQRLTG